MITKHENFNLIARSRIKINSNRKKLTVAEFIHHWFRVWIVGDAGGPQVHVPGLVAERECLRMYG